jgi:thioredoxin-dependent peroxiredoxin
MNEHILYFLFMFSTCVASGQVKVGDKVPEFTLTDMNGKIFTLNEHLGKKNLVIYFYPKDETKGCTAEACSFRDQYQIFIKTDTEVIGISGDTPESHRSFARNHNLPFILLSDTDNVVRKRFGVPSNMMGFLPGRVTYVVDKSGIVRLVFNSQTQFEKHAEEAIRVLEEAK